MNAQEALRATRAAAAEAGSNPDYSKPLAAFTETWRDPTSGEAHSGLFRSRVPRVQERDEIGMVAARMTGGMPWEGLPPSTRSSVLARATLAVCLVEVPSWYKPDDLYDFDLITRLYGRVIKHQETFLRPNPDRVGGAEPTGDGGRKAQTVVE